MEWRVFILLSVYLLYCSRGRIYCQHINYERVVEILKVIILMPFSCELESLYAVAFIHYTMVIFHISYFRRHHRCLKLLVLINMYI
jgi:hypothetical protein